MLFHEGSFGRAGNKFIVDMCMYFITKKHNQKCRFYDVTTLNRLGLTDAKDETDTSDIPVTQATDELVYSFLTELPPSTHVCFNYIFCQTTEIARYIIDHMPKLGDFEVTDSVFIHVRLGDIAHKNLTPKLDYYERVLQELEYTGNVYLTTDSPRDPLCRTLMNKYKAILYQEDEVTTWLFGRTCRHLVLSLGTFSWVLGLLATKSLKWYPDPDKYPKWHGPIFEATDWFKV